MSKFCKKEINTPASLSFYSFRDLIKLIQVKYSCLTHSQQKVADFLLNNLPSVAYSPSLRIAKQVDVSDVTVIRFALAIGFKGYADLKRSVRNILLLEHSIKKTDSLIEHVMNENLFDRIYEMHCLMIQRMFKSISEDELIKGAQLILQAKKIFVLGIRSLYGFAFFWQTNLTDILETHPF